MPKGRKPPPSLNHLTVGYCTAPNQFIQS